MKIFDKHQQVSRFLSILFFAFCANNAQAEEDWTCTEVASIKQENSVLACGVATAESEGEAREKALIRARREFELICETSAECAGKETIVEPMRNACEQLANGRYKCIRGLRYTVLDKARTDTTPRLKPVESTPEEAPLEPIRKATPTPPPPPPPPRSRPVQRSTESDLVVTRSFAVGYSRYNLSLSHTDSTDLEYDSDKAKGNALTLQYAFTKNIALKGFLYSLEHEDDSSIEVSGTDFRLMWGSNFDRKGFKVNVGIGMYSETWDFGSGFEEDFSGALFSLGIGYNFDRFSIDAELSGRESSDYTDFTRDISGNSSVDTTATTFTLGAAFLF